MNTDNVISSVQNPKVKRLLTLQQKSSERRKAGVFVVEGQREIERCLAAGFEVETVFWCKEFAPSPLLFPSPQILPSPFGEGLGERPGLGVRPDWGGTPFVVTPSVYERMAYRGSTEGVIAVVRMRSWKLQDLPLGENPLIVVLESVEKPGNLGAILRSADAAGADAVVVCDPLTDLFNPNVVRASTGAVFSVPMVACTSEECIRFLQERGISILTAQLQDSELYYDTDMRRPTAIVMGTEATGLTDQWRQAATAHIRIPMLGVADSLNVSVSAAILLFEAVRQRHEAPLSSPQLGGSLKADS